MKINHGKHAENKVVDLFAGVGGLSLGFQKAGFDVVATYDSWQDANVIHRMNLKHKVHLFDLSDEKSAADHISQYAPDVIIGGPPCQDFSSAGKRKESTNADLTQSFASIVSIIKPKLFVMENVARVKLSMSYGNARQMFKNNDYGLTEMVLDASYCGVPQIRKRFFCIGKRGVSDNTFFDVLEDTLSPKQLTVADYMRDEIDTQFYYRHPRNYSRRAVYSIDEPSATIRGVNRPIPPNYPGHARDAAPLSDARPLTTMERSRIQTFPNSWKWSGSKTGVEQMIGNAVPVELGKFVGSAILKLQQ